MSYDVSISPEEREEIIRSVPIRLPDHKADDNIDQILDKQFEKDREERRKRAFQKQLELEEQRKERVERNNWEFTTGGRHRLIKKDFQVLFTNDLNEQHQCPICSADIVYPLSNWNMWRDAMGYSDCTIAYEPNGERDKNSNYITKHSCPEEPVYLKRRIEHLENNIRALDKSIDDRIRQAFIVNAVGR